MVASLIFLSADIMAFLPCYVFVILYFEGFPPIFFNIASKFQFEAFPKTSLL